MYHGPRRSSWSSPTLCLLLPVSQLQPGQFFIQMQVAPITLCLNRSQSFLFFQGGLKSLGSLHTPQPGLCRPLQLDSSKLLICEPCPRCFLFVARASSPPRPPTPPGGAPAARSAPSPAASASGQLQSHPACQARSLAREGAREVQAAVTDWQRAWQLCLGGGRRGPHGAHTSQ